MLTFKAKRQKFEALYHLPITKRNAVFETLEALGEVSSNLGIDIGLLMLCLWQAAELKRIENAGANSYAPRKV